MLRDALRAPGRGADTVGTLLIGGTLILVTVVVGPLWAALTVSFPAAILLAPVALAPAIVVRGFYLRVVGAGIEGAAGTPAFVRWGDLYRNGVKSALLSAGYLLPLVALIGLCGLAAWLISVGRVGLGESGEAVLVLSLAFLGLLSVGYLVAYAYLFPAALTVFASSGRLRDGFDPRRVAGVAATADFATGWLLAVVVLLAGLSLAAPLAALFLGFVLAFFVRVVVHWLYGHGAAAALADSAALADPTARVDLGPNAETSSTERDEEPGDPDEPPYPVAAEADPRVQVGRDVPLTATDILSKAARPDRTSGDRDSGAEGQAEEVTADDGESGSAFEWSDPISDEE